MLVQSLLWSASDCDQSDTCYEQHKNFLMDRWSVPILVPASGRLNPWGMTFQIPFLNSKSGCFWCTHKICSHCLCLLFWLWFLPVATFHCLKKKKITSIVSQFSVLNYVNSLCYAKRTKKRIQLLSFFHVVLHPFIHFPLLCTFPKLKISVHSITFHIWVFLYPLPYSSFSSIMLLQLRYLFLAIKWPLLNSIKIGFNNSFM